MATQLKNLKFGDYTIKGVTNSGGGKNYMLGSTADKLTYEYTFEGSWHEDTILDHSWSLGCSTLWHLHGGADYAGCARSVEVSENGTTQGKSLYGTTIPTFSKGGSLATVDELEDWINTFVSRFSGGSGSAHVITGTYTYSP